MVKDLCFNGTMAASTNKYSAPVPWVGLYIAAASMVCGLLILCDVWAGFRRKKYWLPCRFFSINSATLTLISIAAKIPVDLTTNMPSELDQLSKLCGTVFVCMSVSFMLPSLGTNAEFESYANVTALSIFVITAVVNIGIQMATGVIFSFKAEHAIVLVSMLFLLLIFWCSVGFLNAAKNEKADKSANLTRNGEENMVGRLKLCYIYSYHSCIQLCACVLSGMLRVYMICMTCSAVLVQATLRSLAWKQLKFCEGVSDYAWSMRLVVASQFFAVAVITFAIGCRWLNFYIRLSDGPHTQILSYLKLISETRTQILSYVKLITQSSCENRQDFFPKSSSIFFTFLSCVLAPLALVLLVVFPLVMVLLVVFALVVMVLLVVLLVVFALVGMVYWVFEFVFVYSIVKCGVSDHRNKLDEKSEAFKNQLIPRGVDVVNSILRKGVADMERWMEINYAGSLKHLTSLLSIVPPSRESSYFVGLNGKGIKISLLPLVVLVDIAKVVMTATSQDNVSEGSPIRTLSLAHILDEVFEIIDFIDIKVNIGSSKDREANRLASIIRKSGIAEAFDGSIIVEQNWDLEKRKVEFKFIQPTVNLLRPKPLHLEQAVSLVSDSISYHLDESIEVVHGRIKRVFVDMLHTFLAQLPAVVFTHILESPVEEYDERVRLGLGYMCKLQSIQSFVRFSLPPVSNITSLFHAQTSVTCAQMQGVSPTSPTSAQAITNLGEIQQDEQATGQQV